MGTPSASRATPPAVKRERGTNPRQEGALVGERNRDRARCPPRTPSGESVLGSSRHPVAIADLYARRRPTRPTTASRVDALEAALVLPKR